METYDVVLLVEQELSQTDAQQVWSLHQGIHEDADQTVRYHVLLPFEDAASRIETSMGTLSGGDLMGAPAFALDDVDLDAVRQESVRQAQRHLAATIERFTALGVETDGELVSESPVGRLKSKIEEVDGREAIILTQPHVVAEFFHVDWSSQARRKLGVPVLHLLEHETFDQQAGEGEGIHGF